MGSYSIEYVLLEKWRMEVVRSEITAQEVTSLEEQVATTSNIREQIFWMARSVHTYCQNIPNIILRVLAVNKGF